MYKSCCNHFGPAQCWDLWIVYSKCHLLKKPNIHKVFFLCFFFKVAFIHNNRSTCSICIRKNLSFPSTVSIWKNFRARFLNHDEFPVHSIKAMLTEAPAKEGSLATLSSMQTSTSNTRTYHLNSKSFCSG